jgi:recombination protein RecR
LNNSLPESISKLIEEFASLPGIGPRGAARIVYFLLRAPDNLSLNLADSLQKLKTKIKICFECYNYSDNERCSICSSVERDESTLIVVEEPLDVSAFERMGRYKGKYHVLGGVISPVNGIGPEEIRLKELVDRIKKNNFAEIIVATNPNLEGESTALFIKKEIEKFRSDLKISRIARGIPTGADLEYADENTLEKALEGRNEL